jgi:hypothetical protein
LTVPAPGLLSALTDQDNDPLTVSQTNQPSTGQAVVDANGGFTFTRQTGDALPVSFSVSVSDGHGGTTALPVTIALNRSPVIDEATRIISPLFPTTFCPASDPDGDPVGLQVNGFTTLGVAFGWDNCIVYQPESFVGPDSIAVTASDGKGGVTTGTLHVTLGAQPAVEFLAPPRLVPEDRDISFELAVHTGFGDFADQQIPSCDDGTVVELTATVLKCRWADPSADDQTVSLRVVNASGLEATAATPVAVADATPPEWSPTLSPPANANGWNNTSPVTVSWNWSDFSGFFPEDCPATSTASGQGVHFPFATCNDIRGNLTTASAEVRIDLTGPTAAPTAPSPNAAGWYNFDVPVQWNWTDTGGSGIDASACTTSTQSEGQGTITMTAGCSDRAGNFTTATYTAKVDTSAPDVRPLVTPPSVLLNGSLSVTPGASDTGSGIASSSCAPVSSMAIGSFTVMCAATDRAGNTGFGFATYVVGLSVAKVEPAKSTSYKPLTSVAVSFELQDARRAPITDALAASLEARCAVTVALGSVTATCARYNKSSDRWQATVTMPAGPAGTSIPIRIRASAGGAIIAALDIPVVIRK